MRFSKRSRMVSVVVMGLAGIFVRPADGQVATQVRIRPQLLKGACCNNGNCTLKTAAQCGGTFLGLGTKCNGPDCNGNGWIDKCDVATGFSADGNSNNVPDECEISCGVPCDAWKTTPGSGGGAQGTQHTFTNNPIPAGFFELDSLAFSGTVELAGVALDPERFGEADTLVERDMDPLDLTAAQWDEGDCIPRLKALRMQSVQSITVDHVGGGTSQWDVEVGLSEEPQDDGFLHAIKEHANGGTYFSFIPVKPRFVFRRVGAPFDFRVFDVGVELGNGFFIGGFDTPWVHSLLPGFEVFDNYSLYFIPGVEETGGRVPQQFTVEIEEEGKDETFCHDITIPDDCDCKGGPTGSSGFDPGDGQTNFEEGENPPEFGGGDKICTDINEPGGLLHDKVEIEALVVPTPAAGVSHTTYFRIMDPDHYSPSMLPGGFDPLGATAPDDNILVDDSFDIGASLNPTSVTIVGDGTPQVVTTIMTIYGRQPTNNFIVVSHCEQSYVDGVTFDANGKLIDAAGVPVPDCFQTPLLTVWRCLHLELDKMTQADLQEGPSDEVSLHPAGPITSGAGTTVIKTTVTTFLQDQFQGGEVTLLDAGGGNLGVFSITASDVSFNAEFTLTVASPATATQFTNLVDDDAVGSANPVPKINPEFPSTAAVNDNDFFRLACVEVVTDTIFDQDGALPFDLNLIENQFYNDELRDLIDNGKTITSTNDFWLIYAQGAYQDQTRFSYDPSGDNGLAVLGKSTSGVSGLPPIAQNANEGGVLIYTETIRDAASDPTYFVTEAELKKWTLVHEMGHEFGMEHSDGGIMQSAQDQFSNPAGPQDLRFEPISLDRIMRINHPGFGGQ